MFFYRLRFIGGSRPDRLSARLYYRRDRAYRAHRHAEQYRQHIVGQGITYRVGKVGNDFLYRDSHSDSSENRTEYRPRQAVKHTFENEHTGYLPVGRAHRFEYGKFVNSLLRDDEERSKQNKNHKSGDENESNPQQPFIAPHHSVYFAVVYAVLHRNFSVETVGQFFHKGFFVRAVGKFYISGAYKSLVSYRGKVGKHVVYHVVSENAVVFKDIVYRKRAISLVHFEINIDGIARFYAVFFGERPAYPHFGIVGTVFVRLVNGKFFPVSCRVVFQVGGFHRDYFIVRTVGRLV